MAGSRDADALESMGWSPGGIQEGTPGAGGAALALVRAERDSARTSLSAPGALYILKRIRLKYCAYVGADTRDHRTASGATGWQRARSARL